MPNLSQPKLTQNGEKISYFAPKLVNIKDPSFLQSITGPIKRLLPLFDRIVVQRAEAAVKSKGGIIIPEKSQGKVLEATVVAAGPGARNDRGETIKMSVQVGDTVLLPEYGGTKIEVDKVEYAIFREADIVAKFSKE